jgi:outer membrane protein assembly factor BamB
MFAAPPRLLDGELVCTSTEGTLRRLDPDTGTVLGEEDRDALQLYPALEAGGRIVTASTAGVVEARGPGGSWTYDADGAISAEPVAAGRVVLVPTAQGELVALRTDSGEKAWSLGLSGELRVPPILTDQRLILATNRGELYVYEHSR